MRNLPTAPMSDRLNGSSIVVATGHALSLAVIDDGQVLAQTELALLRGHAEALVPAIAALLEPLGGSQWRGQQIVVETGPGSFTGLRVGLAAATGLSLAWGANILGVRSTQLVAADVRAEGHEGELLVALAAPRGQIWVERFAAGGLQSMGPPAALLPEKAKRLASAAPLVAGSALPLLGREGLEIGPRAAAAAILPKAAFGAAALLYVRPADAD